MFESLKRLLHKNGHAVDPLVAEADAARERRLRKQAKLEESWAEYLEALSTDTERAADALIPPPRPKR